MPDYMVGCGQITWGRDTPEDRVLTEIAQAGYEGAPAGPSGSRTPDDTLRFYTERGLRPAPGYFSARFWDAGLRDQIVEDADRHADFTAELGLTELYIAADGFDGYTATDGQTRRQTAGRVRSEHALTDDEFQVFGETLNAVAHATLQHGVRSCFHNHVGTVIETGDEIARLLSLTDSDVVFLGPDTGHLAWAGADPVEFCRRYAHRIKTLHLKDVQQSVVETGRRLEWDYGMCSSQGVWTELGEGDIDFPGVFEALGPEFIGWLIVETDVTQLPSALESAQISRTYLRGLEI
ncbi:MAG: sugar phosphate isomerase/epimerase [Chloroflexia bacterium]